MDRSPSLSRQPSSTPCLRNSRESGVNPSIVVLKFGSSVLQTEADLPQAIDEIYREWRAGRQVIAVVSAFAGVTDRR